MKHRPNILKLATKISLESLTYTGLTYNSPEYKILEPIVDDDMCRIMMHMRLEKNRTVEEIAKRAKCDVEFAREQCEKLMIAGVIRARNVDGKKCYYYPIWVPGIMEGILANREQCDKYPILGECFEEYTRIRIAMLAPFMGPGMNMMRVIPVAGAIETDSKRATYDEIGNIIDNAWAISVGPCSCRRARRLMGEGCGHLEEDMCMYINDNAINYSETGAHRLIDKKEAYEIIHRAERNGLVHELNVSPGYEDTSAICNCCGCSCFALRIASYFRTPDAIRTNYIAKVNKRKCAACGKCVENCQVNAIKLGKKLSSDAAFTRRPDSTPQNTLWTSKNYNIEYRTNRTNTVEVGSAPCKSACPANVSVQAYIQLASEGRYDEALELIKEDLPFPAVCGRICNKKCEDECTRGSLDAPIAIDEIKKFIADHEMKSGKKYVPELLNTTGKPYTEKIAVIGGGPAGLSCAYYLAIKGYPVTVFERENALGGMLALGIPSFRLDKDVLNAEIDVLKELGVELKTGVEIGKDMTIDELRASGYKAFYLAIGASNGAALSCPGADKAGVITGIDFLRDVNLGKDVKLGKQVAVIGGGNVALDVARSAVRLGADVTIYYRRSEQEMPADKYEQQEAAAEGIKFAFLLNPAEVIGKDCVETIKLEVMHLGEPDENNRRKPVRTGKFQEALADTVICATGQEIDMCGIDNNDPLRKTAKGNIAVDAKTCQTGTSDIFAGGDVVTGPKFAIDAIAAGKEAAISIHRFVHPGQTFDIGRDPRDYRAFTHNSESSFLTSFDTAPRQHHATGNVGDAIKTFDDLRATFTADQVQAECERCLGCGNAVVDEFMCIGCGVCYTKCKFDAIKLERVHDADNPEYFHTLMRIAKNAPKTGIKIAGNSIKNIRKK